MSQNQPTNHDEQTAAWETWGRAVREPDVDAAIRGLYARLDEAVAQRGPTCWISGRCCNFDAFGHRLYVTALEITWVMHQLQTVRHDALARDDGQAISEKAASSGAASTSGAMPLAQLDLHGPCVFQKNNLCSIHTLRPMGCRIFFCQEGTDQWQQALYEQFLDELRRLHEAHDLPYRYLEWRAGLAEAHEAGLAADELE